MKDKIRNLIFIISIIYSIIVVVLMIYSYTTSINTLEFKDDTKNIKILNEYKKDLENIEESTCKASLNSLINHYEITSYNGKVNLKDKYLHDEGLLNSSFKILNDCKLDDDVRNKISLKLLTASIQFDEVLQKLYFQYEIGIPDLRNRLIIEPDMNNIRYRINRKLQLEVIEVLIDTLKGE